MSKKQSSPPTVDFDFLDTCMRACPNLQGTVQAGSTTAYTFEGKSDLHKRTKTLRKLPDGQIGFEKATGLALNHQFLPKLLKWYEENKSWREGAYFGEPA